MNADERGATEKSASSELIRVLFIPQLPDRVGNAYLIEFECLPGCV